MKLTKIEIFHFGKLNNLTFDLDNNLEIFQGQNEAGKSTTVAFIKQIIFGFYLKSTKSKFFENYVPLEKISPMGGKLTFESNNDNFILERLYSNGDSKRGILKVYLNNEQVPENTFFDRIKNIDGNFYADSFIFNQDMLREVSLLSQNELMEQIYFLGASQSNKLIALRDNFTLEAEKLFKKTGRKPEINQLIRKIELQKEKVEKSSNEFNDYKELNSSLKEKQQSLLTEQSSYKNIEEKQLNLNSLEEKITNYKKLLSLKAESKPIDFSQEELTKIKNIKLEIKNLQDSIYDLKKREESFENNLESKKIETYQDLVDQKAELIQWLNEKKTLEQRIASLTKEIKKLNEYQPEAKKFNNLNNEQRIELKENFKKVNNEKNKANNNIKILGISFLLIGLFLFFIKQGLIGLISLIIGLISIYYDIKQKNNAVNQADSFKKKYGFDLENNNFEILQDHALKINSKETDLKNYQKDLKEVDSNISNYKTLLENYSKQNVEDSQELLIAINELQKIVNKEHEQLRNQKELKKQRNELEIKLKDRQLKLQKKLNANQVENIEEFEKKSEEFLKQERISLEIETIENNLKDSINDLEKYVDDKNNLKEKQVYLNEKKNILQEKISRLQEENADLKLRMKNLADSDDVYQQKQTLANLEAQLEIVSTNYLANLLVSKWIGKGLDIASNERFPKMLESAKLYFSILTGGQYKDIELNKKISVKNLNNKKIPVEYLSRGTSEQLYLALKLAFVEQINDEISLPILIDDAFVNFDAMRIEYIKKLLKQLSMNSQVLIFTQNMELSNNMAENVQNFS